MQKRSHRLLASSLIKSCDGFRARRFELAFLFGSFQPDCNPLSYLKGSLRCKTLGGHNYTNSGPYIRTHIDRLQQRGSWTMWQYYTLGKLTHYLADAFTYPHNENYPDSLLAHRQYEDRLRKYLAAYLGTRDLRPAARSERDVAGAIADLHRQYMEAMADMRRDVRYIIEATSLLMAYVPPRAACAV